MEENDVFGDVYPVQGPNDLNITRNQNLLKGENIDDINIFLIYAFEYLPFFFTLWTPSLLYVYTYTHTVTYSCRMKRICICVYIFMYMFHIYIFYSSAIWWSKVKDTLSKIDLESTDFWVPSKWHPLFWFFPSVFLLDYFTFLLLGNFCFISVLTRSIF